MDREALRQRLLATFVDELDEHVDVLNRDGLALEHVPASEHGHRLTSLFRSVHSLKGAARAVGIAPIEAACHRLESRLARARDGQEPLDGATIQLVLAAADALADAGRRLRARDDLDGGPLTTLLAMLDPAAAAATVASPVASTGDAVRPRVPAQTPENLPPLAESFARVPVDKLDRLIAAGGEFLVARRRAAAAYDALEDLHADLRQWRAEWLRLEPAVRRGLQASPATLSSRVAQAFDRTRDRSARLEQRFEHLAAQLRGDARDLERVATQLEDEIRQIRMFPFHQACQGLARPVRDLARAGGKQVRLVIEGGDVELGRFVLERLRDPLLHLVRNAVDHGIERPEARRAAGKPAEATIRVGAALRGGGVDVSVSDDGRGLDLEAIRDRARRQGLPVPDDDRACARLVFQAGFSTATEVTEVSGRGVGLEIVRHEAHALHGHVDLTTDAGRGTRVVLTVPVTVATIRALLVAVAGQIVGLPVVSVQRLVRAGRDELAVAGGREVLLRNGQVPLPVVPLAGVLGYSQAAPVARGGRLPVAIVAAGDREAALVVDEFLGEDEVMVKHLGPRLRHVRHVSGATLLPSGRIALLLAVSDVIATALTRGHDDVAAALASEPASATRRVLVVDDSVTTRSLERSILEAAGYEVLVASDGREAWRLLHEQGVDLVVADVEMPRMDGIALCEAIRRSARLRHTPVVLVTALESERDRLRGLDAGADAYLPKSSFDQRALLDTIADLL